MTASSKRKREQLPDDQQSASSTSAKRKPFGVLEKVVPLAPSRSRMPRAAKIEVHAPAPTTRQKHASDVAPVQAASKKAKASTKLPLQQDEDASTSAEVSPKSKTKKIVVKVTSASKKTPNAKKPQPTAGEEDVPRCPWAQKNPAVTLYHDTEYGKISHDDRYLFELLSFAGQEAGLSWALILRKREHYKKVFHNFDVKLIANMTDKDIEQLMTDTGLIRSEKKLQSILTNARACIEIQKEFGSLDKFVWSFVNHKQTIHDLDDDNIATSKESEAMSKEMIKRGFRFVGARSLYWFMQCCGLVCDHHGSCFLHNADQ